jgi:antitoxin (DNA-binding transcriptional repressor) of toxin-antitoxin stability system
MVTKTIDLQKTPASLEELLQLVEADTQIVLTQGDKAVARLLPPVETEASLQEFRTAARAVSEEIAKAGLSEDELMQLLEDTRQEVFEERYDRRTS